MKLNGIPNAGSEKLLELLKKNRSCFGIKLVTQPPADFHPFSIKLAPNATPHRTPQRRYFPPHRVFIKHTIQQLEKIGAVYRNDQSRWAYPELPVPKPGTDKLRFTVDLRGTNARTVPLQSAMLHLESLLQYCEGSKCFANIYFSHGYWQIPLDKASQEIMSIQTPLGIYSPTRTLKGGTGSGNHFQAVTCEKFEGRVERILQWLKDFLLHAMNEDQLLDNIAAFLIVCKEVEKFKVNPRKSCFFTREVKFCGRIISADGIRLGPRNFEELLNMKAPRTGDELQQLICVTKWMRTAIPDYARLIEPLHQLLEQACRTAGKRTKKVLQRVKLDRTNENDKTFQAVKKQLAKSTTLSLPKDGYRMCLFSDASDTHWAGVRTQFPDSELEKELEKQSHDPLCFLLGSFHGSSSRWSVPEKEGYAIVESLCRLD